MNSRPQLLLDARALISAEAHPHGKVIAQVWRASPRQHILSRIRQMCRALPFTEQTAEDVGRLLARSRTSDVVDGSAEHLDQLLRR
jgi:hypothetical protein